MSSLVTNMVLNWRVINSINDWTKYRVSYSTFILILIEKQCKNGWRKQNFRHNKHSKTGCYLKKPQW